MGFQSDSALKSSSTSEEMQDTQIWFLGWEDLLENSLDRGAWQAEVYGVAELDTTEATKHRAQSKQSTTT